MSKFTPKKWTLKPAKFFGLSKESNPLKDDLVVCVQSTELSSAAIALVYCDNDQDQSHARLIASAPELLEWCRDALATLQRGAELMPLDQLGQWEGVRAVIETCPIAKAEGRES